MNVVVTDKFIYLGEVTKNRMAEILLFIVREGITEYFYQIIGNPSFHKLRLKYNVRAVTIYQHKPLEQKSLRV